MDEDYRRCGNELLGIWGILHHGGDPRRGLIVKELASVLGGINQLLISSTLHNRDLAHQFSQSAAKTVTESAPRLASAVETAIRAA